jgi:predicted metal-dependent enzyme (double-stranded beta helix superfamily)
MLRTMPNRFLEEFSGSSADIVRQGVSVPERIAAALAPLLAAPDLIPAHLREPAESYRQGILYVQPAGLFSIVALVWGPHQATPVHDHICWCVVGVYEGLEREEIYLPAPRDGEATLHQVIEHRTREVYWHDPGVPNIHRVSNPAAGLAASIHVYGADIRKFGNSIRKCYSVNPPQNVPICQAPSQLLSSRT